MRTNACGYGERFTCTCMCYYHAILELMACVARNENHSSIVILKNNTEHHLNPSYYFRGNSKYIILGIYSSSLINYNYICE